MSESTQKKLLRVRPPRVRITYDVHTNGAIEKRELPFIVGIFADLSGDRDALAAPAFPPDMKERKVVEIDRDNFNEVLRQSMPRVVLRDVPNHFGAAGDTLTGRVLAFESLMDFEPINIVRKVDVLASVYGRRKLLRDGQARAEVNDAAAASLEIAVTALERSGAASAAACRDAADRLAQANAAADGVATATDDGKRAATATAFEALARGAIPALERAAAVLAAALAGPDLDTAPLPGASTVTVLKEARTELDATVADARAARDAGGPAIAPDAAALAKLKTHATTLAAKATALETATAWSGNQTLRTTVGTALATGYAETPAAFRAGLAEAIGAHVGPVTGQADGSGIGLGAALAIDRAVAGIDKAMSRQLSAVMHSARFREMESTWRGLFHLVSRSETGTRLKLRLFNATLEELRKDLTTAVEFDQSRLFKLVYEAEYGTYGGSPYSMLLGGYEITPGPADMTFLELMSGVAAAAHAPFLAAASPAMFGLKGYADLARPRDLAKIFEGADLQKWSEFRDTEDSRYVSLVMPRAMLRLPYGEKTLPAEGFGFEEAVLSADGAPANDHFLWGNAAYFLAERITNAFALYSWTGAIRGVEGGGLVEGLPIYTFGSGGDEGVRELFCPTEVAITDRREKELNDLGFIALCHCKGSGRAAFFGGQTTNKPRRYINADANANAALSSRLPYILAASRFAHYIKVIVRDKVGGFLTRGNVETYLNTWIAQYVLLDDNASQDVKSAFPLREASIQVVDVPGEPGAYKATVFLKPHFQLEELTTSIRLVADLPK